MIKILFSALLAFAVALTGVPQTNTSAPAPEKRSLEPPLQVTESSFTGADGVRLFYRRVGRGKSVAVFLHGGPGINMHDGDCYFEPLAQGRTIIMYDQRGGGRSELIRDPKLLTAEHHVRDLEALRQHFGLERMDIIGLSWGTGLAALYAAKHPERVRRMLLVGPMPVARIPYADTRRAAIDAVIGTARRARLTEIRQLMPNASDTEVVALCRELYNISAQPYLLNPANWEHETCERCDAPPASIRNRGVIAGATLDSLGDWDFRPILSKLRMPALVIEGAVTKVPLDSTRAWAESMPNARLLLIENAGHLFPVEQPVAFRRAANRFLRGGFPQRAEVVRKSGVK
jgi:proline iminopeptidase